MHGSKIKTNTQCHHYILIYNAQTTPRIRTKQRDSDMILQSSYKLHMSHCMNQTTTQHDSTQLDSTTLAYACTAALYASIFLLRMSSIGPSTRVKVALSSASTFTSPTALQVACRGLDSSRAISPK